MKRYAVGLLILFLLPTVVFGCGGKSINPRLTLENVKEITSWADEEKTYENVVTVLGEPNRVEKGSAPAEFKVTWLDGVDITKLTIRFKDELVKSMEVSEANLKKLNTVRREALDEL